MTFFLLHPTDRSYGSLSLGERWQASVARLLGRPNVVIDEFTSPLDRGTAVVLARGLQQYTRRHSVTRVVLVGCHSDMASRSALDPDWVFCAATRNCSWYKVRHPDSVSAPATRTEVLHAYTVVWEAMVRPETPDSVSIPALKVELDLRRCPASSWALFR